MDKLTWRGFLLRFAAACALVLITFNPSGYSFLSWAAHAFPHLQPLQAVLGIALLIGWIVYVRATMRSLGIMGVALVIAFLAAVLWLFSSWGWIDPHHGSFIAWLALFFLAVVLALGMSWSHIRRRLSGQADVDEVARIEKSHRIEIRPRIASHIDRARSRATSKHPSVNNRAQMTKPTESQKPHAPQSSNAPQATHAPQKSDAPGKPHTLQKPELESSRSEHRGRVVDFRTERIRYADGRAYDLDMIYHPGASAMVAVDDHHRVCLVRQYRHGIRDFMWEIPAGKLDRGEAPMVTAVRELTEETGVTAGRWESLGPYIPAPGLITEVVHLFLALDLQVGAASPDADEELDVCWMPMNEAVDRCLDGRFNDGKTVMGLVRAQRHLNLRL